MKFLKNLFRRVPMGVAKNLRESVFADFIKWLEFKKVPVETFSMDVWMSKAFDVVYDQYAKDRQAEQTKLKAFELLSEDELSQMVEHKKRIAEAKAKAEATKKSVEVNAGVVTPVEEGKKNT